MGCCESEEGARPDAKKRPVDIGDLLKAQRENYQDEYFKEQKDPNAWRKVEVPATVQVRTLHENDLEYIEDIAAVQDGDAEWCCNGVEIFKGGCKSGQQDLGVHEGIKCWRSVEEDADFDLCEQCIQWVLYNLKLKQDIGIGSLTELSTSGVNLDGLSAGTRSILVQADVQRKVDEIFRDYDKDQDGLLTREEIQEFIENWVVEELGYHPNDGRVQRIFNLIDFNSDGYLDRSEVTRVMMAEAETKRILREQPKPENFAFINVTGHETNFNWPLDEAVFDMRASREPVKLNSLNVKHTDVLMGIKLGFTGGFESSLYQAFDASEIQLERVPVDPTKEIKQVGFYSRDGKKGIIGLQFLGESNDEAILDQIWYNGGDDIALEIHEVPAGHEIIGLFGRVEKDVLASVGFICWKKQ